LEDADAVAGPDQCPRRERGAYRLVGRPKAALVGDGDDAAPGDRADEGDLAGAGREHPSTGGAGEVDASVSGQPWPRRRVESPGDHGRSGERPAEGVPGAIRAGRRRGEERRDGQQGKVGNEPHRMIVRSVVADREIRGCRNCGLRDGVDKRGTSRLPVCRNTPSRTVRPRPGGLRA
jgi:hypothetical protein